MRDWIDWVVLAVIGMLTGALLGIVGNLYGLPAAVMVLSLLVGGLVAIVIQVVRRR